MAQRIDGFSLENILQIFSLEKKSQTLRVTKEDKIGLLDIDQGELIHAELPPLTGLQAAQEILVWEDVQIELLPLRPVKQSITSSLINILLEVSKLKDDRKTALEESGEEQLQLAIEKAEQHQYKAANQFLTEFLKKNKNSVLGWIWYARIQGNADVIRKALNMATSINPHDILLREEKRKFALVEKDLRGDSARKCYFCWTPLNKTATQCTNCKGFLLISEQTLAQTGKINKEIARLAQENCLKILRKFPRSLPTVYTLALVHMNLGNFKEALMHLDRATKMAPERTLFSSQLNLLLDYLARSSAQVEGSGQPLAQEHLDEVAETPAPAVDKKVILVVEDSTTTRKVITITLTRHGYKVIEAGDGLEALSKISEERPNLILLDVILPKMDGYKILSIIKGNDEFKEIPVIMLTSKDGFMDKMKGKMARISAYLTKPFAPDKMIAEIEKHIK